MFIWVIGSALEQKVQLHRKPLKLNDIYLWKGAYCSGD